jgi:hypothetical protein
MVGAGASLELEHSGNEFSHTPSISHPISTLEKHARKARPISTPDKYARFLVSNVASMTRLLQDFEPFRDIPRA